MHELVPTVTSDAKFTHAPKPLHDPQPILDWSTLLQAEIPVHLIHSTVGATDLIGADVGDIELVGAPEPVGAPVGADTIAS